jgi:hypothetical protein
MRPASQILSRAWIGVPVVVGAFLIWAHARRVQRLDFLSSRPEWSVDAPAVDATSPTGFENGERTLIVPERNPESLQWIAQTQQMLATGTWRVRRIDYENAPYGRPLHDASPYRWWLGALAWLDHLASGRPLGAAVERMAKFADPILQLLLLAGTTVFVARRFGTISAVLVAIGIGTVFPFAAGFAAGLPEQHGLERVGAMWSVLLLVAGMAVLHETPTPKSSASVRRWFFGAGLLGGLGLWLDVENAAPILAGIVIGALAAAWLARRAASAAPAPPWHVWSWGIASMSLIGYAIEFLSDEPGLQLKLNHPLHALFWLGAGELLARTTQWIQRREPFTTARGVAAVIAALAGIAALPLAVWLSGSNQWFGRDPLVSRLVHFGPIEAESVHAWFSRDGFSATLGATLLPVVLCVLAFTLLLRRTTGVEQRVAIATAIGPTLVALVIACTQLRWWHSFDALLLALVVAASPRRSWPAFRGPVRWWWYGAGAAAAVAGALQLLTLLGRVPNRSVDEAEILSLVERDLAHWLGRRAGAGNAIVLAAPDLTTSLAFHGAIRGVATVNWENPDGFAAAVRIASARSRDEAFELTQARGITHLVVVSWDSFTDDYVRLGRGLTPKAPVPGNSFLAALRRWDIPPWIQLVPYQMPVIEGFAGHRAAVFEVVENQDPAVAASRLVEALVDMGDAAAARAAADRLKEFPGDAGALAAHAFVHVAARDNAGLSQVMSEFVSLVESGADGFLPWDRQVSVASVLAFARRTDLARDRVERCLAELDETRLRSLTPGSLLRLLRLCRSLKIEIQDPALRAFALRLVPPAQRREL